MKLRDEEGQAIVIAALAMSIFLLGALGLAVDGAHMYAQRQMAQTAADGAALAGIMSIFGGTNGAGTAGFSTTSTFTCTTTDAKTPCAYAINNGFGSSTDDTVTVDFPPSTAAPGVALATGYPANLLRVTIQRNVKTTLMGLLGPTSSTIKATATAAIVNVSSPVPLIIMHPTLDGSFSTNGGVLVTICGGPHRSIQVNSSSSISVTTNGGGTVDLTRAGPPDTGDCKTGNGADFGNSGGPTPAPFIFQGGSTGAYLDPTTAVPDPLLGVDPPPVPSVPGKQTPVPWGTGICPASTKPQGCTVLTPGLYPNGISLTLTTALFQPGIYYIQGTKGFTCKANCNVQMASPATVDVGPLSTNTGWNGDLINDGGGILVYNTGTGQINLGANGSVSLLGAPMASKYLNILFFEDRKADPNTGKNAHSLGGGGAMTLWGTIYLTNTKDTMLKDLNHYQELDLQGNPGNTTKVVGEIIVDTLHMAGKAGITMNLNNLKAYTVNQVALVN